MKSNNELKEWRKDIMFWEGFDAAIDLVLNTIDNEDQGTMAILLRDLILDEVEIYKRNE